MGACVACFDGLSSQTCDVRVVGFGTVKHSMAWYHAKQLAEGRVRRATLRAIVSPSGVADGSDLQMWVNAQSSSRDCRICASVVDMPPVIPQTVAVIACRTSDMPQRLCDVIDHGVKFIYLEKPGAPSLDELKSMARYAEKNGAEVYMGYNKNVAKYVGEVLAREARHPGSVTRFVHNNMYTPETLDGCFTSNSEGMLKNMAIHELMIANTFYDVTVENLKEVCTDTSYSVAEVRCGLKDFSKVRFTLTTREGKSVQIQADRCGGITSSASILVSGEEVFCSTTPDAQLENTVAKMDAAMPGVTTYLHLQDAEYLKYKQDLCKRALGGPPPQGMPTLSQGVKVLELAEHLTPVIMKQLGQ